MPAGEQLTGFFLDRLLRKSFHARKEEASLEAKGGGET